MKSVLADTGPIYALVDPDDQYHDRAQRELADMAAQGYVLQVALPTLLEAYTLILRNLGIGSAQQWWREMTEGSALVNPTRDDYFESAQRAGRYTDQVITLFDAVVALLAEKLGVSVWTYDFHFDVMGVDVWR
jgi:predicted nucleic acid-binding protein